MLMRWLPQLDVMMWKGFVVTQVMHAVVLIVVCSRLFEHRERLDDDQDRVAKV